MTIAILMLPLNGGRGDGTEICARCGKFWNYIKLSFMRCNGRGAQRGKVGLSKSAGRQPDKHSSTYRVVFPQVIVLLKHFTTLRVHLLEVASSVAVHFDAVWGKRNDSTMLHGMRALRYGIPLVVLCVEVDVHVEIEQGGLVSSALLGLLESMLMRGQQVQVDVFGHFTVHAGVEVEEVEGIKVEMAEISKVLLSDSGHIAVLLWLRPGVRARTGEIHGSADGVFTTSRGGERVTGIWGIKIKAKRSARRENVQAGWG